MKIGTADTVIATKKGGSFWPTLYSR